MRGYMVNNHIHNTTNIYKCQQFLKKKLNIFKLFLKIFNLTVEFKLATQKLILKYNKYIIIKACTIIYIY